MCIDYVYEDDFYMLLYEVNELHSCSFQHVVVAFKLMIEEWSNLCIHVAGKL
jgi:hypothetical protein